MHSAVKVKGQRLYKLAHRGEVIEREPRPVTIYGLEMAEIGSDYLDIRVRCSRAPTSVPLVKTSAKRWDVGRAF